MADKDVIKEERVKELIAEAIDKPLKMIEAGGDMENKEAKQILRFAVRSQAVVSILTALRPYIRWDDEKKE